MYDDPATCPDSPASLLGLVGHRHSHWRRKKASQTALKNCKLWRPTTNRCNRTLKTWASRSNFSPLRREVGMLLLKL